MENSSPPTVDPAGLIRARAPYVLVAAGFQAGNPSCVREAGAPVRSVSGKNALDRPSRSAVAFSAS